MNTLDISHLSPSDQDILSRIVRHDGLMMGTDNDGQILIYTDLALAVDGGELVDFDPDASLQNESPYVVWD